MHQIKEVSDPSDVSEPDDMEIRKNGRLLEEIKSIIAKEPIIYTTRLENMGVPFQGDNISLESIEQASKPTIGQMKEVDVKTKPSETVKAIEPLHNDNSKEELNYSLLQPVEQTLFRDLCTPLSVTLTDYRKCPMLNTKEIILWRNTYKSRLQNIKGEIDHVVIIVHEYLNLTETFYMSDHGVVKEHNVTEKLSEIKRKIFEIKVCCWYSRNKRLRDLYLQLEENIHADDKETRVFQGLSRYLPHYVMLCGNHMTKCPIECRCCEICKTNIWFQKIQTSKKTVQRNEVNAANKSLIAKALAFTKSNEENTNQNITRQEQPNGALKNELLEIQHVTKNISGICNTVNKLQIIEIGHKGQIQTYIEKHDFETSDLVDESMKKTVFDICCWKKLQITIDLLKEKNIQPEIRRFIQQRHTCLINNCQCCCSWPSGTTINFQFHSKAQNNLKSLEPEDETPKSKISVKTINYLTKEKKHIRKPPAKSRKLKAVKIPATTFYSGIPVNSPTPSVTPAFSDQHTIRDDNMLDMKTTLVPPGTSANGYKVYSNLMKSIIDEEITRLIRERNMIPNNISNRQMNTNSKNSNYTPLVLSETKPNVVPPLTEVNDHINQILEKFKDIRLAVTQEGKVKAIISHPPQTPGDMTLLKNILQKIQVLLDEHTEKSDKTLSNILGPQRSHLVSEPQSPAPATLFVTNINIPSMIPGTTPNTNPKPVTYYLTNQRAPTPFTATIAQHAPPGTFVGTSDTLVDLLKRAPIPPNFPISMSTEDDCLMNIRIEKVESLEEKSINTVAKNLENKRNEKEEFIGKTETTTVRLENNETSTSEFKGKKKAAIKKAKSREPIRDRALSRIDKINKSALKKLIPLVTTSISIPSSTSTTSPIGIQTTLGPSVIKPLSISSSVMTTVPKTSSAVTCQSTLLPSSYNAVQLPPLMPIGQSAFMPSVSVQCSSMHSIPHPPVSSSFILPIDIPTVNAQTILYMQNDDGMETETILGE